jgi:hypothetical protein
VKLSRERADSEVPVVHVAGYGKRWGRLRRIRPPFLFHHPSSVLARFLRCRREAERVRTRDLPEGIDKFPDQRGKEGSVCLDVLTCVLFCSRTCFGLQRGLCASVRLLHVLGNEGLRHLESLWEGHGIWALVNVG